MDGPGSQQRMIVALVVIALAAGGVWFTMDPGRYRALAWVLLGFFAFRVMLGYWGIKRSEKREWVNSGRRDDAFPREPGQG